MTDWSPLVRQAVQIALRDGRAFVPSKVLPAQLAKEVAISYLDELGRREELRFRAAKDGIWLLRVDVETAAAAVIDEPRD